MINQTMSAKGGKILILSLVAIGILLGANSALAFDTKSIVLNNVPYATFQKGTFDNLVLDFNLLVVNPDTLKALSLKNLGSANYLSQMKYLKLWADAGSLGFQGMGVDREIGNFNSSADQQYWYLENLTEKIIDGQRFFVTVETYSSIQKSATIQLEIPQLADANANGSFDFGDKGLFMDSGNNGPANDVVRNQAIQVFSDYNYDNQAPKIIMSNLSDGAMISTGNFLIQGKIRDQGNSQILSFTLKINDQTIDLTNNIDPNTYAWSYNWQNITDGAYTISLQAYDASNNLAEVTPFKINAQKQSLNLANSIVILNRLNILADGMDKAVATVNLKDDNNFPLIGWPITVLADPDLIISLPKNTADTNGQVSFEIRATAVGTKSFTILVNGQTLKTLAVRAATLDLGKLGINYGDLIKTSSAAVYYLGADGKRYVFPSTQIFYSWYHDFSTIKTISAENFALLPLGGVVTYKPGIKMIKIASDPKVYAIDSHATLRWVKTEAAAKTLYGNNWATKIDDVPATFFSDYKMGADIETNADFNPAMAQANASTFNEDKGLK